MILAAGNRQASGRKSFTQAGRNGRGGRSGIGIYFATRQAVDVVGRLPGRSCFRAHRAVGALLRCESHCAVCGSDPQTLGTGLRRPGMVLIGSVRLRPAVSFSESYVHMQPYRYGRYAAAGTCLVSYRC